MLASLLVTALLSIQLRAPETLRPPAAPPPDGTGKFQEYAYTYHLDSHVFVIAFTPALPAKRATVLDALKSVCRDLYNLDFTKAETRPGTGPNEWMFELNDLRTCYGRETTNPAKPGEVKSLRVWMP